MDSMSTFFRSSVPNYFSSLPLPNSIRGFASLSAKEWLQLIPFVASLGLVGYVSYKEVNDYLHRKEHSWVNKDYCKSKNKIADIISKSEINAAIEKNDTVAYCRCWKSKKVLNYI